MTTLGLSRSLVHRNKTLAGLVGVLHVSYVIFMPKIKLYNVFEYNTDYLMSWCFVAACPPATQALLEELMHVLQILPSKRGVACETNVLHATLRWFP